jgi:hypothetical protein
MRENWYRRVLFAGMGLWVGGVLAFAFGVGAVVLDLGPWWAGVAIGTFSGVVGAVAGGRATYDRSMHDRLHGALGLVLFVGVPVAFLVAVLASVAVVASPDEGIASALFAGALLTTVGGIVALLANVPLWKATVRSSSTSYASWSARQPPTQRRRTRYAAGTLAVLVVGYVALSFVLELGFGTTNWALFLAPLVAVFGTVENERSVEVRDGGVLVDSSLVAWTDYDVFELTDEALVLHRDSRFFDRATRFDRADVEDLDAAVAGLERFLERRER